MATSKPHCGMPAAAMPLFARPAPPLVRAQCAHMRMRVCAYDLEVSSEVCQVFNEYFFASFQFQVYATCTDTLCVSRARRSRHWHYKAMVGRICTMSNHHKHTATNNKNKLQSKHYNP